MTISTPEQLEKLQSNTFMGTLPMMKNSNITFAESAKNNVFFCEENVRLVNSAITFNGSNSIVFLCSSRHNYSINASMNNNNVLYIGRNNYINGCLHIVLSEQKHFFIGNGGMFSFGIWVRTADPHLIYTCDTKQRINPSQSVFIGDHVWIGQGALILKGTQIDSGSIIGGMSVVANKKIRNNSSWAGNPCRQIKDGIFWDGACVHGWIDSQTKNSAFWETYLKTQDGRAVDSYIYEFDETQSISFSEMDSVFTKCPIHEKLEFLKTMRSDKNRFVHFQKENPHEKLAGFWRRRKS